MVTVDVDGITAARLADHRVFKILTGEETVVRDAQGNIRPTASFLADLHPGDLIHVKGKKDREHGTLMARRIKLLPQSDESA